MSTDCDDSDSSVQSSFSGATQIIAAESCMEILDEGFWYRRWEFIGSIQTEVEPSKCIVI